MFRVGIFLDFASSPTCTLHGAHVQMRGRNRIDPHRGEGARLVTRAVVVRHKSVARTVDVTGREKERKSTSGSIVWVGTFRDFVRPNTRTLTPWGVLAGGQTYSK